MSKAPAFQYYAKDHIATKASLTIPERGAWSTLVDHCWENGAPISMALAIRLVGSEMVESIRFLLHVEGDTITFDWIEETRAKQAERSAINAANGRNGGRGKSSSSKAKSERFAKPKRTKTKTKPFRAEDEVEDEDSSSVNEHAPTEFDEFYASYPNKKAKGAALTAWVKLKPNERAMCRPAIESQVKANHFRGTDGNDYIPHPASWLNARRWEDEITEPKQLRINGQQTDEERRAERNRIIAERYAGQ